MIGAYQFLLDWHLAYYTERLAENPNSTFKNRVRETKDPVQPFALTTDEKKRILTNNIYGVDLDQQAVEVSKLSLLLKMLEEESAETTQFSLFATDERILPDLSSNIKWGNSLIESDFYSGKQLPMFDAEEIYRVKAFDWDSEFADIMKNGGFDAVIGNPPYIRIQTMKETAPESIPYYKTNYASAKKGNYDIYVVFVERGLKLLNPKGRLGYILPHKFFNAKYGEPLRGLIAQGKHLAQVVHFGSEQVFAGATTYTCLMFLDKSARQELEYIEVENLNEWQATRKAIRGDVSLDNVTVLDWNFVVGEFASVFNKLQQQSTTLGSIARLFVGLQTDADAVYILEEVRVEGNRVLCKSKETGEEHWFEDEHLKHLLKGSVNIARYNLRDVNKRLIFPYQNLDGKSVLISEEQYQQDYPLTWDYLKLNQDRLSKRNKGRMGDDWYGYVYKKNHTRFGLPKLIVPSLAKGSAFAEDFTGKYYFVGSGGGGGGGYGIVLNSDTTRQHYMYLLGVLNSNLLTQFLKIISTDFRGGYIALNRQYIEQLPIRTIDFDNPDDKAQHDRMVGYVEEMLALHKQLAEAQGEAQKGIIQNLIERKDKAIDKLVYELYGLSDEEIKIVEGE